MKKAYEAPKAEKMAFAYKESVVASVGQCVMEISDRYRENYSATEKCREHYLGEYDVWYGDHT
ncbi:MAG: hypothetical protein K6A68_07910 [Clostridiales bacterium]|nr:hypothetical protein [Clostridiales bacterium]